MTLTRLATGTKNWKIILMVKSYFMDCKAGVVDSWQSAKKSPIKASIYTGLFIFGLCSNRTIPKERSFEQALVSITNDTVLLSDKVRNKEADSHVQRLSTYIAKGQLRYRNLGLFSVVYYSEYDKDNKFYESQYVKPKWSEYPSYIVDVGFLNCWWYLQYCTTDYDINFEEIPKDLNTRKEIAMDYFNRLLGVSYFGNPALPLSEQNKVKEIKL